MLSYGKGWDEAICKGRHCCAQATLWEEAYGYGTREEISSGLTPFLWFVLGC